LIQKKILLGIWLSWFDEMSHWLKIEALARRWREFFDCCAMTLSTMSFSHGVVVMGASEAPAPSGRREAKASFPAWRDVELLSGVLNHAPLRSRCSAVSWAHESDAFVALLGGKAQAAEVVGDELEVPKTNGFAEGESPAR
jgi:hypothetical protein